MCLSQTVCEYSCHLVCHNFLSFLRFFRLVNFSHSFLFEHFWVGDAFKKCDIRHLPSQSILWHAAAPTCTIGMPPVWPLEGFQVWEFQRLPFWCISIQWGIIQNPAFFWWLICQSNTVSREWVRRADAHCKCGFLDLRKKFYLTDLVPWYAQHNCSDLKSIFANAVFLSFPALELTWSIDLRLAQDRNIHILAFVYHESNRSLEQIPCFIFFLKIINELVGRLACMSVCILHSPLLLFLGQNLFIDSIWEKKIRFFFKSLMIINNMCL